MSVKVVKLELVHLHQSAREIRLASRVGVCVQTVIN